eukprot:1709368-Rhodomonas_salina.1
MATCRCARFVALLATAEPTAPSSRSKSHPLAHTNNPRELALLCCLSAGLPSIDVRCRPSSSRAKFGSDAPCSVGAGRAGT